MYDLKAHCGSELQKITKDNPSEKATMLRLLRIISLKTATDYQQIESEWFI